METAAVEPVLADAPSCWCCGNTFDESDLTRLGAHPEVGVCAACAHWLDRRARLGRDRDPAHTRRDGAPGHPRGPVRVMHAGIHDWLLVGRCWGAWADTCPDGSAPRASVEFRGPRSW